MASILGLAGIGVAAFNPNKSGIKSTAQVFNRDFDLVPLLCDVIDNAKDEQEVTVSYEGVSFTFSARYVTADKTNKKLTIAPNGHLMNITAMNGLSSITIAGDDDVVGTSLLYGTVEDGTLDLRKGTKVEGFNSVSSLSNVTNFSLISKANESASVTKLQVAYTCDNESMDHIDTSLANVVTNFAFVGAGTQANPYRIENEEDFEYFRSLLNSWEEFEGEYVTLINDLECVDEPLPGYFKGDFDGNNKTVHLEIDYSEVDKNGAALFSHADGAHIHDFDVDGYVWANESEATGAVVGYLSNDINSENCVIENINVYSQVSGDKYVGGVVGYAYSGAEIKNCTYNGCYDSEYDQYYGVDGSNTVGGIVGYAQCDVIDCTVTSNEYEIGGASTVGGVVGFSSGNIIDCIVEDDIAVSGTSVIGGIAGNYSPRSGSFVIDNCTFSGTMDGSLSEVGGIAGTVGSSSTTDTEINITNCTVTSDAFIQTNYTNSNCKNVGGIAGTITLGNVDMCNVSCNVYGKTYTGGIVGNFADSNGEIDQCVFDGYAFSYTSYCGGIAGTANGVIFGCSIIDGKVNTNNYSGGIAGYSTNTIEECINFESEIIGSSYTGGIVGYTTYKVLSCNCDTSSISGSTYVGGIV